MGASQEHNSEREKYKSFHSKSVEMTEASITDQNAQTPPTMQEEILFNNLYTQTSLHPTPKDYNLKKEEPVKAIELDIGLKKDSLRLVFVENTQYAIQFRYDSKVSAEAQIYICATEEVNEQKYPYIKISSAKPKYPTFKLDVGKEQLFSHESAVIDKSQFQESDFTSGKLSKSYFPMIIIIKALYPLQVQTKYQTLYTYVKIVRKNDDLELKALSQKLLVLDKVYQLYDIYGTERNTRSSNEGSCKECIICFTNIRDTLVIPCRHLCLCSECSFKMREQRTKTCPLCRTSIYVTRYLTVHYYQN